ncbi:hypothetical protein BS47DRAFT_481080 [Hydnum rufescens UP504]|uniref:Uncharacterized protein n=1 Tax=Hydnum rufescens UP504 TaxID=1448309 RepID=A0A9P6DK68_9AGAM|nr:hypothetical protein BS47DRAFT_481080 [Hydnum rufescens UP504]
MAPDIDSEVDGSGEDSEESSQPKSRKRRSSRLEIQFPISDDEMDIDNKGPIRPRRRLRRVVPETVGSTDSDDDDDQDDGADVDQQEPDTEASSLSSGHARLDDHQSQFEPIKEGDPKDQAQWAKMSHRKNSDRSSHEPRSALQDSALPGGGSDEAQGEEELAKSSTSGTKRENASSPQPAKRHRTMMSGVPLPNSHHTVSQSHTELVIIHSDSDESEMEGLSAQPPIRNSVD